MFEKRNILSWSFEVDNICYTKILLATDLHLGGNHVGHHRKNMYTSFEFFLFFTKNMHPYRGGIQTYGF